MFHIQPMLSCHYTEVYALWQSIEGVELNPFDDSLQAISDFLAFNPDLNYIATVDEQIVGVIMCGFDGRRATIYHAAVKPAFQGKGIATALLRVVEQALHNKGVTKGRLLAFKHNEGATAFWQHTGWTLQQQLNYFSKNFN